MTMVSISSAHSTGTISGNLTTPSRAQCEHKLDLSRAKPVDMSTHLNSAPKPCMLVEMKPILAINAGNDISVFVPPHAARRISTYWWLVGIIHLI